MSKILAGMRSLKLLINSTMDEQTKAIFINSNQSVIQIDSSDYQNNNLSDLEIVD